ncbi:MAG TPA: MFS transporter, partial [Pseudonocardiaceae bacterium]|nr:MFS transporter [Pseudonocardiaceae bacterium]
MPKGLEPLRHSGFRLLTIGQLASNLGDACYAVALPWYVLAQHGGPLLLGTVLVAYGVPRTALLMVGGSASDRWRPWTVMMASDVVRALAVATLAVAAGLGPANVAVLGPVAVVLGAGEGLFLPGSSAIVPALLPDDDLQAGNAISYGGTELATLVGPAVGGAVVALVGPAPAFWVDAVTFAVSAGTLAGIRSARAAVPQHTEPADRPKMLSLLREPVLLLVLLVTLAANLGAAGATQVALPALAHGPLRTSAAGFGGL